MTSHLSVNFCRRPLQNSSLENTAVRSIIMLELKYFFSAMNYHRITHGVFGQMRILIHSGFAVMN